MEVIKPSKPQIKNTLEYAEAGDFLLCIWFFPEEYWKTNFWEGDGIQRITVGNKYNIESVIGNEITFINDDNCRHITHINEFWDTIPLEKIFKLIKKKDIYYL